MEETAFAAAKKSNSGSSKKNNSSALPAPDSPRCYLSATLFAIAFVVIFDLIFCRLISYNLVATQMDIFSCQTPRWTGAGAGAATANTKSDQIIPMARWWAAGLMYSAVVAFVVVFVVRVSSDYVDGLMWGAIGALILYGVHVCSNLASFAGYSWQLALMILIWSVVLLAGTSCMATYAADNLKIISDSKDKKKKS